VLPASRAADTLAALQMSKLTAGPFVAWVLLVGLTVDLFVGCKKGPPPRDPELARRVAVRHADLAAESYEAAAAAARDLQRATDAFVAAPSEAGLEAARRAWRAARVPYTRTEAFRFYGGPIDAVEPLVNAWPVDESYIDSLVGDKGEALTPERLAKLNEREGEKNISVGFHAIEYLLWGQDLSDDGPGRRPAADFGDGAPGAARRREYLRVSTALLARHLEGVADAWRPGRGDNYRASFLRRGPSEAAALILKGLGTLTGPELTGERITVAIETKDQENEHSCFSDNTLADLVGDLEGLRAVYLGGASGPGLRALIAEVRPDVAARLEAALDASLAAARAVPPPFDRAIVGGEGDAGRRALRGLVTALSAQTAALGEAAAALGLGLGGSS
jgi:putative iron-regulated protein